MLETLLEMLNVLLANWYTIVLFSIAMKFRSLVHVLLHNYKAFDEKFNIKDDFWFDPSISWLNKYLIKWTVKLSDKIIIRFNIPVQVSDAFHFFNTLELLCYLGIVAIYANWYVALMTGVIGVLIVFNFFYKWYKTSKK